MFQLDLSGIGIDRACLKAILGRGKLERLNLSDSELKDDVIHILNEEAIDNLVFLDVHGCRVKKESMARLETVFPCWSIETSRPVVDPDGVEIRRMEMVAR